MSFLDLRNTLVAVLIVAIATVALVGLSACAGTSKQDQGQSTSSQGTTSEDTSQGQQASASADWDGVGQAIGKDGKLMKGDVYRVDLPRSDLKVTSQGVEIKSALSLGSYAAFKSMDDSNATVMGDLVLTEDEYNKVISTLQEGGIGQTA